MTTTTHNDTAVFPLLADPAGYVACPGDLATDTDHRAYWMDLFRRHQESLLNHALAEAAEDGLDLSAACNQARKQFTSYLDTVTDEPNAFGRLDVLSICKARENALRAANIADPYRRLKERENQRALKFMPLLLKELDAAKDEDLNRLIIEGVFAGNIFDMGAEETLKLFDTTSGDEGGTVDFAAVRAKLKPRPWKYDALDVWSARLAEKPYQAAVLFVDNAGPDVVLGMIPLARHLLKQGTSVILSANTEPALNDVTHEELTRLIDQVAALDSVTQQALQDGRLRLVESGNWAPLMDLTKISPQLAAACQELPIDLVVLEGMGRSMESNPDCKLKCDCLRLAMVKDLGVAKSFNAELFDLVMRFTRA